MTERQFDAEALFDNDYLHLFAESLEERSEAEADLIWRLLDLRPGLQVLDLACGHGRIANRLAARGCQVTGLDSSEVFLRRAREDAIAHGVSVDYVPGDMRQLPWRGKFDRVVNWFTAFGYFDDEQNRQVLSQIAGALKPGGQLGIERAQQLPGADPRLPAVGRHAVRRRPGHRPAPVRPDRQPQHCHQNNCPRRHSAPNPVLHEALHVP